MCAQSEWERNDPKGLAPGHCAAVVRASAQPSCAVALRHGAGDRRVAIRRNGHSLTVQAQNEGIAAAYDRAAMAYAAARAGVYSQYPDGLPARSELSERQRRLLDDEERENATVKDLRQARIRSSRKFEQTNEAGGMPRVQCPVCGEGTSFDERLPYVNQTASFSTGHDCVVRLPK